MRYGEHRYVITKQSKVLVTGATGLLGGRLATRLASEGFPVRALARNPSRADALRKLGVEIALGDLGDEPSIRAAVRGVEVVVHAGAGTSGSAKDADLATIQGTRNVLKACSAHRVRKLVYISSCNVYEVAGYAENQVVTEEAQLERYPLRRGHYSAAKRQAEELVTAAINQGDYLVVILRPGTLYGPGAEIYTRMMGISFARRIFIVFGDGTSELPLVHVENAVDAIVECMINSAADNQVFNVVDHDTVTKKMYMERVVRPLYPKAVVIYCPMPLLLALTWLQEKLIAILGRHPVLTVYRVISSQKRVTYSAKKIENMIGWRARVKFEDGAEQMISLYGQTTNTI